MKMSSVSLALALSCLLAVPTAFASHHQNAAAHAAAAPSAKHVATDQALRDLWVGHVFWVRNYVVASADKNTAAQKVAADQVVENAKAISAAIVPFYGQAAGDQLLKLLAGHWGAVKAHADATFAGDKAGQDKAVADLTANARQIAQFLSKANPHLTEDALYGLLAAHGGHHVSQNTQIKAGDYAAEAQTWDAMRKHMYVVADALTDALAKQFPAKF